MKRLLIPLLACLALASAQIQILKHKSAPVELASYNCSPVENPISDGGNFSALSLTGPPQAIAGNICEPTTTVTNQYAFYTGTTWPDNQYSEITMVSMAATTDYDPIVVRKANSSTANYYIWNLQNLAGSNVYAVVGGTYHSIGTITTGAGRNAAGTVFRLSVTTGSGNNVLHAYEDGVEQTGSPITDSTYYGSLTSGVPGFDFYCSVGSGITGCQIAKWAGGSIP